MNIFKDIPHTIPDEIFETFIHTKDLKLERIISKGHTTPAGEWYDQKQHEWVLLLAGSARITFTDDTEVFLQQGDHLIIPAHTKHRVTETDNNKETIWLALHYTSLAE